MSSYEYDESEYDESQLVGTHPHQPVVIGKTGTYRFKENKIVTFLLEAGKFNMNDLGLMPFSNEDRTQFAQLIGYSVAGFGELPYVSDQAYDEVVNTEEFVRLVEVVKDG